MKRYFACIGFSCAIALFVLNIADISLAVPLTAGSAVMFVATMLIPKYRQGKAFPLCFGSVLFACVLFLSVYYGSVVPSRVLGFNEADCAFYIIDVSENAKGGYSYIAKTQEILFNSAPQTMKIKINTDAPIYAEPYQLINARLKFYSVGKNAFSSYGYWGKGIYLSARLESYEVTDITVSRIGRFFVNLRSDIVNTLYSNIGSDEGAFSAALLTGKKSLLSSEAYYAFRYAGMSHLMAVSGLHLTVMTGAFMLVFKALRLNGKLSSALLIAVVVSYCTLAGFSSSVVRAGIMMCVILLGNLLNRRGDLLNSLGVAVFIICLNPFAVSDSGAVLSVLAMLSLSTGAKAVTKYNEKLKFAVERKIKRESFLTEVLLYIADSVIVSVCILLYTLPAMYLFFGYFSVICVFINVFIMPLGSIATVLSLITYISNKTGILCGLFNFADRGLNAFILKLVRLAGENAVTVIRCETYFGIVLAIILIIFAICFFIGKDRLFKLSAAVSVIALVITGIITFSLDSSRAQVLITDSGAVALVSGEYSVVYGIKNKSDYYSVSSFLNVRDRSIDLLVVDSKPEYSAMLSRNIKCEKLVSKEFYDELLDCDVSEYEVSDKTRGAFGNTSYSFDLSGKETYYGITVNGVTVTDGYENATHGKTVCVADKTVYDNKGYINLEKGDVLYGIYSDGTLAARRLNIWES